MNKIATPGGTKAVLSKYPFILKKKYGQNFLIDEHVLTKIISAANISKNDCVLEIGPGIGSVTQELLEHAQEVIAVEIDKELIPILNNQFGSYDNFALINEDFLKLDLKEVLKGKTNIKVVANLPYYITTPIIMALLESELPFINITVMVQKEVADRITALPGTKEYGSISASIAYYAKVRLVANVPMHSFLPRPTVNSAVIELELYRNPPVDLKNKEVFFKVIRAAFSQRRKTILNTLSNNFNIDKKQLKNLLEVADIAENVRGETLGTSEFAILSNLICSTQ
ncbi:16S rRNA (adenine(1518)-N(6)/adenine(1519)-N(6))-dimethyltransferase RsmA [Candidatus Epulonipiscium viviparus]|uniref:16S rRNA (adenine(1518)-N(6)/adenine(1519)-N(6))- dimethyltransferase RsmA n=1 Tax=Candidatus Epulonipiscium viviparus TaxID=420336 RepID=UPI00049613C6|nr:16S rRNA (adenine(1518)-N(6)/adenine(1519)-N(6))-dimethyltransferase RsmA [Candidatus Epulopiscium viviparus]